MRQLPNRDAQSRHEPEPYADQGRESESGWTAAASAVGDEPSRDSSSKEKTVDHTQQPDGYDGTQDDIPWLSQPPDQIAYGTLDNETAVFMPLRYAEPLGELRSALSSSTWGELRAQVTEAAMSRMLARWGNNEERLADGLPLDAPGDEEPLSPQELWGHTDGDWPDWPAQRMLDWVPTDIAERFGQQVSSVLNGEFLKIPASQTEPMARALQTHGFQCERDDDLVLLASGWL